MCDIKIPKIKIVGIGGTGCTIINPLLVNPIFGVEYYVADSDEKTLGLSSCENKIKLPTGGSSLQLMAQDIFKAVINDEDMVIIVSGLGGNVGSTFTPLLAEVVHTMGIKVVAIVTTPFEFEGKTRMTQSVKCLEKLKALSSTVIVMPNHRIKKLVPSTTTMYTALSVSNTVILEAVNCIISPICEQGYLPVNYEDFISVLREGALSYLSVGTGEGENAIHEAIKHTIYNPLPSTKIEALKHVLIHITCGTDFDVPEILTIGDDIRDAVAPNANIELSAKREQRLNGKVRIGLIGFADEKEATDKPKIKAKMSRFENKFNDELNSVITKAEELAKQFETQYIASEHLVYAMLLTECKAGDILRVCGCDEEIYEKFFVKSIYQSGAIIGFTPRTKMILQHAEDDLILDKGSDAKLGTEHILNATISCDSLAFKILNAMNVNIKQLKKLLEEAINS